MRKGKKLGPFYFDVNLTHAVMSQAEGKRKLYAYGICIGDVFFGWIVSRKDNQ